MCSLRKCNCFRNTLFFCIIYSNSSCRINSFTSCSLFFFISCNSRSSFRRWFFIRIFWCSRILVKLDGLTFSSILFFKSSFVNLSIRFYSKIILRRFGTFLPNNSFLFKFHYFKPSISSIRSFPPGL